MPDGDDQTDPASDVPDEYSMEEGRRPDRIRRRNRITGLLLLLFIAAIIGATIWSRSTGDAEKYNPVGEPADELGDKKSSPRPGGPATDR